LLWGERCLLQNQNFVSGKKAGIINNCAELDSCRISYLMGKDEIKQLIVDFDVFTKKMDFSIVGMQPGIQYI
jgi:hypothetical protein